MILYYVHNLKQLLQHFQSLIYGLEQNESSNALVDKPRDMMLMYNQLREQAEDLAKYIQEIEQSDAYKEAQDAHYL